jgi:hypothetical protein
VSRVHGAWTGQRAWVYGGPSGDESTTQGASGVVRLRSSPTEAREGENDEAVPMMGSLGHGRQWRGDTMAMEDGGRSYTLRGG